MPRLDELKTNAQGIVTVLQGPQLFLNRACSLGFTPGARVSMVRNPGKGPLLVYLRDTLIALGRKEAAGIGLKLIGASAS